MNMPKNLIAIHFSAYCLTNYGQNVCITGNCPQLGMWDPKKGLKLHTNPREYPIWFSKKPITLQKLTNLQYKLCIVDKDSTPIKWENLKQNRTLSLKTSCSIFLTDGQPEVQFDFDNSDSTSTQINSTRKTTLSQIQEESEDDESPQTWEQFGQKRSPQQRKRSGSSIGRSTMKTQLQCFDDNQLIKFQSDKKY